MPTCGARRDPDNRSERPKSFNVLMKLAPRNFNFVAETVQLDFVQLQVANCRV